VVVLVHIMRMTGNKSSGNDGLVRLSTMSFGLGTMSRTQHRRLTPSTDVFVVDICCDVFVVDISCDVFVVDISLDVFFVDISFDVFVVDVSFDITGDIRHVVDLPQPRASSTYFANSAFCAATGLLLKIIGPGCGRFRGAD